MIQPTDLRRGMVLDVDGNLMQVVEYQSFKIAMRGNLVKMKLKNIKTGAVVERTVSSGERFTRAFLDTRPMQYLYSDDTGHVFMDQQDFEQITLSDADLGDNGRYYLKEGVEVQVQFYDERPVGVDFPITLDFTVARTDPGLKGDTVSGALKPATTETGLVVQVPLFINEGDRIRVDTRTGEYLGRA
jgi:elongation factor P